MAGKPTCFSDRNKLSSFITPKHFALMLSKVLNEQIDVKDDLTKGIRIVQRNRDLKAGDFAVPGAHYRSLLTDEVMCKCRQACQDHPCISGIQTLTSSATFPLTVSLHRGDIFKLVLSEVLSCGNSYGTSVDNCGNVVFLHLSSLVSKEADREGKCCIPLHSIRTVTMLSHVQQLLTKNGYKVRCIPSQPNAAAAGLFKLLHTKWLETSGNSNCIETLKSSARKTKYRCLRNTEEKKGGASDGSDANREFSGVDKAFGKQDGCVTIDLRRYLKDNLALRGYDKSIHFVDVLLDGHPTDILHEVCNLEDEFQTYKKAISDGSEVTSTVLHLSPHSRSFTQQQIELLWRLLSPDVCLLKQVHLIHGSVVTPPDLEHVVTPESFYRLIHDEMREAAVMKYGDQVKGDGWERNIDCLALATLKTELLSSCCKSPIKLSVPQSNSPLAGPSKRSGTFVMYNCARLATLFSHFEQAVGKGTYPALPPVDQVDFTTLREEEEWVLLFNYVWPYPDMVAETVQCLGSPSSSQISVDIQTHKVCSFLVSLSQHISTYYSRCHILGQSRPHLYPLMFARLYLMKAVHQVITNGLNLLDTQPLKQL